MQENGQKTGKRKADVKDESSSEDDEDPQAKKLKVYLFIKFYLILETFGSLK